MFFLSRVCNVQSVVNGELHNILSLEQQDCAHNVQKYIYFNAVWARSVIFNHVINSRIHDYSAVYPMLANSANTPNDRGRPMVSVVDAEINGRFDKPSAFFAFN